jgi:AsmA-like C-terminal region
MALPILVKRTFKTLGALLLVLIIAAVSIPYFFKDKIIAKVKEAVNKELNATVDFKSVDISLLRHFPKVSVELENLSVVGKGEPFDGVTLLNTEGLDIALDFWSVWNGGNPYSVHSFYLKKPFINVVALKDGSANYNITKPAPTTAATEPTKFKLNLANYAIENGTIIYDDRALGFYTALKGLNHEGSGEMTADVYDLDTETAIDSFTMSYGNMTYLKNAKTDLETVVNADMKAMKFMLKKTKAKINSLDLNLDGWAQLPENGDILMDFVFKAPSNNFKDFLSIIPAAYTKDYSDVKANGNFTFDGFIKGTYNGDKTPPQYPAFKINLAVNNGSLQYPKLPMGISDINTQLVVALPNSNFDNLALDINKFHIKLGANPFDAVMKLRTPVSDPNVDASMKGTLNLGDLPKALPMESVQNLSGTLIADVTIKTLLSFIEKKQYEKVNMNGALNLSNMTAQAKGYPSINISNLGMNFSPNYVDVKNFVAKLGKSDIAASGRIDNLLAYFSTNKTMTGTLKMQSNVFDANEWLANNTATANTPPLKTSKEPTPTASAKPFDRFDFTVDGSIGQLLYEKYDIRNAAMAGHFTPNAFKISKFQTQIGNSDVAGSGTLDGVFDWLFDNKMLTGNVNLTSNRMDLNQFMTETPQPTTSTATNTPTEPFQIPDNMNVTVTAKMGQVQYTNMDLRDVSGKLMVADQKVSFNDAQASALGGRMVIDGEYDTKNAAKPLFKINYDMKNVDIKETFTKFNTFQKFAPIGNFLTGRLNTTLAMNGALGKDLSPDFTTFNMDGFFQTLQGLFTGFAPLNEIGNKLNISELKNFDIKETKNWISIQNGVFTLREFDKTVAKDVNLKIAGSHSLANDMTYTIKARVPRKRLEANAAGQVAGAAFNNIVLEANKLGLNIKNSEFVNVLFTITGNVANPKVAMKVMGGDGEATIQDAAKEAAKQVYEKAKDSVMNRANEELDKAKQKGKEVVDKAVDSATNVANRKIEEAKEKALEEAKKRAGDEIAKQAGGKVDSLLQKTGVGDKVKKEADKVKGKLDDFNPFKKKPKEGGN